MLEEEVVWVVVAASGINLPGLRGGAGMDAERSRVDEGRSLTPHGLGITLVPEVAQLLFELHGLFNEGFAASLVDRGAEFHGLVLPASLDRRGVFGAVIVVSRVEVLWRVEIV